MFKNQSSRALDILESKNSDISDIGVLCYKLGTKNYQSMLAAEFDTLNGFKATSELDIKLLEGVLATY